MRLALWAAIAATAVLAGCSSPGQSSSTGAPTGSASTARVASTTTADPNAGLRTGTELKALLLTTKDIPAGFTITQGSVRDSADVFGPLSTPTAPTKASCKALD